VRTDLVFTTTNGDARRPDYVTNEWRYVLAKKKLPKVKFHAMRHTHASALIASGCDIVTVSRRLGHAGPTITLSVYAHLFDKADTSAATAIDKLLAR
jgi:integrase